MRFHLVPAAALSALLMACTPIQAPQTITTEPTPCGAEKLAAYIGKADSAAARADIARLSGATTIRWLTPGMAVTMDYRPERLNADIDADGNYTRFHCV